MIWRLLVVLALSLPAIAQIQVLQFDGVKETAAGALADIGTAAPGDTQWYPATDVSIEQRDGGIVAACFFAMASPCELLVETPDEEYERGAGNVVGQWEKLDGSEDVRVTAKTEVRLIAVDHSAYEAALTG